MTRPTALFLALIAAGAVPFALACGAENATQKTSPPSDGFPCGLTPAEMAAPVASGASYSPVGSASAAAEAGASGLPDPR